MHWHESFSVGVKLIDEHHRRLFTLINELIVATETQQQEEAIGRVLQALIDYTKLHFRSEETLFRDLGTFEQHAAAHRTFEQDLLRFIAANPTNRPESTPRLITHLTHWLQHHILQTDIATFSELGFRPREPQEAIEERLHLLTHKPTVLIAEDSVPTISSPNRSSPKNWVSGSGTA
ncbi:MAG: methyl-accepting chemotaxis sensory transducer [Holophagaceae bacterium]|nr:methyl-accepting chemotaxis sensory transducer [Holophagaceae bacterium]